MRHTGDLAKLRLFKLRVGHDDGQGRIAGKLVIVRLSGSCHHLHGASKALLIRRGKACDLLSGMRIKDIAKGIQNDYRPDLKIPRLNGIAADPGLHAVVHAFDLADRCAAACSVIAVLIIRLLQRQPGRLITHVSVGTHRGIADRQIVNIRLCHQRDHRIAGIISDPLLFKVCHHPVRRAKAVGAAAGKDDRMNGLGSHQRIEQLTFP